jgi:hypothetical protein
MAKKGGKKDEHRMLFDLQGRRRNVIKVVYAVLAVLMGLSLLLIAGPLPFGDIFGAEDAQEIAREQADEREERIQVKLAKNPNDPVLLASLTRAQLAAASSLSEENPETGQVLPTTEGVQQLERAASSWEEYLEATDEPSPNLAASMARSLFTLAEFANSGVEIEANVDAATEAQQMFADKRPNLGSLGTLALFYALSFDYPKAKEVSEEAKKFATSKFQREQLDRQLEENEKRAKEFQKQFEEEAQLNKQLQENQQKAETEGGSGGGEGGAGFANPFSTPSGE